VVSRVSAPRGGVHGRRRPRTAASTDGGVLALNTGAAAAADALAARVTARLARIGSREEPTEDEGKPAVEPGGSAWVERDVPTGGAVLAELWKRRHDRTKVSCPEMTTFEPNEARVQP